MLAGKKTWTMTIEGYGEDIAGSVQAIADALKGQTLNRFKIERAGEPDLYPALAQPVELVKPVEPEKVEGTVMSEGTTDPQ